MNPKTILSKTVGLTQTTIGAATMLFAFLMFYNIFDLQATLGLAEEAIGLYLWAFIIFGLLSAISGLFLFYQET
jgi:vacuolar-type H+-ATPase subunit I/STV1